MEHFFTCPYCWQEISFVLDCSEPRQRYVEDCEVCCKPIEVEYQLDGEDVTWFDAHVL